MMLLQAGKCETGRRLQRRPLLVALCVLHAFFSTPTAVNADIVVAVEPQCKRMDARLVDRCLNVLLSMCAGEPVFPCVGGAFAKMALHDEDCSMLRNSKHVRYKDTYGEVLAMGLERLARDHGVRLHRVTSESSCPKADNSTVVFVRHERLGFRFCDGVEYVVFETRDAASCHMGPEVMNRVAALVKHHLWQPPEFHNGLFRQTELHLALVSGVNETASARDPPLSSEALGKLHAVLPSIFRLRWPGLCGVQAHFMYVAPLLISGAFTPRPWEDRSIDVLFLDRNMYVGDRKVAITVHRKRALDGVRTFASSYSQYNVKVTRFFRYRDLIGALLDSKVLVSPWGYGEFSGKDYEAMACGTAVVKPMADKAWLQSYPPEAFLGTAVVDPNMRNITAVLLEVLQNADAWESKAQFVRRALQNITSDGMARYAKDLRVVVPESSLQRSV